MTGRLTQIKDPQMEAIYNMLPEGLKAINPSISINCREELHIIRSNLENLYGGRADWKELLKKYQCSKCGNNREISDIGQVKELSEMDIKTLLTEQFVTKNQIKKMVDICEHFNNIDIMLRQESPVEYNKYLCECLQLLGIYPDRSSNGCSGDLGFFEYIVDQEYSSEQEYQMVLNKFNQNLNVASVVVSSLYKLFIPGLMLQYPSVGNVIRQQKQKWYFRGENAFYGSSKPGLFRGRKKSRSKDEVLIDMLKYDECGLLLDNFNAIRFWDRSSVNYLALFQHYGLKTEMIDITSDLMTALFFACCKYVDGRWYPLDNEDIAKSDSRKQVSSNGGDSRYGIIYRARTEIMDMEYEVNGSNDSYQIIPIGYQPFMRCSNQYGYMMRVTSEDYDMYKDKKFEKFKFRLTAVFCQWVYDEMEQGHKAYPNNDIPNIEKYIKNINSTDKFSEAAIKLQFEDIGLTDVELVRPHLKKLGYSIRKNTDFIITQRKIAKINRRYTIVNALNNIKHMPVVSPMFAIY